MLNKKHYFKNLVSLSYMIVDTIKGKGTIVCFVLY
jgi:hypothetical protein